MTAQCVPTTWRRGRSLRLEPGEEAIADSRGDPAPLETWFVTPIGPSGQRLTEIKVAGVAPTPEPASR